ncbi:LysR family transcriptional regulator [Paludibacterium yongneupense]|uniref:LysR family transcriptional regulator n=1 Tax=Paludibacterium yongneupense TaxID=400061 RepID=UPI0004059CA1|nr:LysR family transcriptional regulator [Paludibacterium yongneupense]
MDEKDWQAIIMVAEEKNITKAAARLYVSQPALTYRLRNIENEFGAKLMSRSTSGIALTPQGEYLHNCAKEMLLQLRNMKNKIRDMDDEVGGSLYIGTSAVYAHYELPDILKGFLEKYPDVDVSLKTGLSNKIITLLYKKEISLAIVRGEHHWEDRKFLLNEEPICLTSHRELRLEDLPSTPQISYGTDSSLQKLTDEWWRETFNEPRNVTMEVDSMDTARQMVLCGLGWAILPAIGLRRHDALQTQPLIWKDGTPLTRKTWLLCSSPFYDLRTVQAFIGYVKECSREKWMANHF